MYVYDVFQKRHEKIIIDQLVSCSELSLPWEGPYLVAKVIWPGSYRLQEINDVIFPNAWNKEQLRKFSPLSFLVCFFLPYFLSLSLGMRRMMGR
jgi:hypothetical protein